MFCVVLSLITPKLERLVDASFKRRRVPQVHRSPAPREWLHTLTLYSPRPFKAVDAVTRTHAHYDQGNK